MFENKRGVLHFFGHIKQSEKVGKLLFHFHRITTSLCVDKLGMDDIFLYPSEGPVEGSTR